MANFTSTQEDLYTKSVAGLTIQPSIMEGNFLYSSLYGPRKGWPLFRQAPLNLVAPRITGSTKIPSLMKCEPGQWEGAPYPRFAFQWMSNGNDIPGATEQFWLSSTEYHDTDITVEVRGYSRIGESYAWTDPVHITVIETIDVNELEFYIPTGIGAQDAATYLDNRNMIVTGIGAEEAETVMRGVNYTLTGIAAESRYDMNMAYLTLVQGVGAQQRVNLFNQDISIIWQDIGYPLVDSEFQDIPLKNNQAELGMAGWDVFGTVTYLDNDQTGIAESHAGSLFWYGGPDAGDLNIPYSYMSQIVELWDVWHDDIDASETTLKVTWFQRASQTNNQCNLYVRYLSDTDQLLGSNSGPGLWGDADIWFQRTLKDAIPANTRKIEFVVEYQLQGTNHNYGFVDNIHAQIIKGDEYVLRNSGPEFKFWRVRFLEPRNHSGSSFQELEFNIGGTNQVGSGSSIFGSAGSGDPNYLFDGIINNGGYWAGENGSIADGSSWVGYEFITEFKPDTLTMYANSSTPLDFPREFMLEGSDDGSRWIPVQLYTGIPDPASSEALEFTVLDGPVSPVFDYETPSEIIVASNTYKTFGNKYSIKSRISINTLRIKSASAGNLNLYLIRYDDSIDQNGMITEVLGSVSITAVAETWVSGPLDTAVDLEIGDKVAVLAHVNDVSQDQKRISLTEAFVDNPLADFEGSMEGNYSNPPKAGDRPGDWDRIWMVDFSGNVF